MLPKKIPDWLLVAIWLLSLVPPLVVNLWLWDPVFTYKGNEKVGEIVSDMFLAFFSAFPFWWAIEAFQRRTRRIEIAKLQHSITKQTIFNFNRYVDEMAGADQKSLLENPHNHIELTPDNEIRNILRAWKKRKEVDHPNWDWGLVKATEDNIKSIIEQFHLHAHLIEPYRHEFPVEFNHLTLFAVQTVTGRMRQLDAMPNRYEAYLTLLCTLRDYVVRIENAYRKQHNLQEANHPGK